MTQRNYKDSVGFETPLHKLPGVEVDREAMVNSNPPPRKKRMLQEKIDEAFDEKLLHDPLLRSVIDQGHRDMLSELYSLKKLVVLLLNEKEQELKEKMRRLQVSTASNVVEAVQSHQARRVVGPWEE